MGKTSSNDTLRRDTNRHPPPQPPRHTASPPRESAARRRPEPRVCGEKNRLSLQALEQRIERHRLDGQARGAKTHAGARVGACDSERLGGTARGAGRPGAKLGWRCVGRFAGGYPRKRPLGCVSHFAPSLKCPGLSLARTVIECGGMKPTILTWANAHLSHWHADDRERFVRLAVQCWDPRTGEAGLASLAASLAPDMGD